MLRQLNFVSGTTTWRECVSVLWSLLRLEPLKGGPWIQEYEREFANYLKVKHAFSFAAGRMAFHAILKAMGIGNGDEVILPGYTCAVVPTAVIYAGARPVYVDINPDDYNIDVTQVESEITPRTRAVLAQHTYGRPCDLNGLRAICERHGLYLIEDGAHALGATYNGRKVGSIGDAAFFSSEYSKTISTYAGGMAVTNNKDIAGKLQTIYEETSWLSRAQILKTLLQLVAGNVFYHPRWSRLGQHVMGLWHRLRLVFTMDDCQQTSPPSGYPYPARLSNIQAKIGVSQVRHIEGNLAHRRRLVQEYQRLFGEMPQQIGDGPAMEYSVLRFPLGVTNQEEWSRKLSTLMAKDIWFSPILHAAQQDLTAYYYQPGSCPSAEQVSQQMINFPTHPKVRLKDVSEIGDIVKRSGLSMSIIEVQGVTR